MVQQPKNVHKCTKQCLPSASNIYANRGVPLLVALVAFFIFTPSFSSIITPQGLWYTWFWRARWLFPKLPVPPRGHCLGPQAADALCSLLNWTISKRRFALRCQTVSWNCWRSGVCSTLLNLLQGKRAFGSHWRPYSLLPLLRELCPQARVRTRDPRCRISLTSPNFQSVAQWTQIATALCQAYFFTSSRWVI